MIRLLIVDDHPIVRSGLRGSFSNLEDIVVVGEAGNGEEGVKLAVQLAADVVLMDLRMPILDGVQATAELRATLPSARVIILTTFDSENDVLPAIEAGAIGYLLKDALPAELVSAVRSAARGEAVLAPAATAHLIGRVSRPESGVLTNRELEVLQLVADSASNKEAAATLFIGQASVETHLQHIFHKLGVNDRAPAVAEGYRRRLLS